MTEKKRKYVLLSVFNKKGISAFAKILNRLGYKIIASEGTGKELTIKRIPFIPVRKISKNPNKLKGCIKTISFQIEAGILFDRLNSIHIKEAKELRVKAIDIVVCNFPPFERVIKNSNIDFSVENIDIGGPTMVMAAAINFKYVLVVVDPSDYKKVAKAILEDRITYEFRKQLAIKALTYIRFYNSQIIKYLKKN